MENPRISVSFKHAVIPLLYRRGLLLQVVVFALALTMGRVRVFHAVAPLGMAFLLAMDIARGQVYAPAAGALIGALFAGESGYPAGAAVLAYLVLRAVFPLWKKRLNNMDKLALGTFVQLLLLPVFFRENGLALAYGLSGTALTLTLAICFQNAVRALYEIGKKRRLQEEEQIALCLLLGACALACMPVRAYAFSLGMVLCAGAIMLFAYCKGLPAVAAAVVLGGMLLLGGEGTPLLLADFALCALFGAVCRKLGHIGVAGAVLLCAAITESYFGQLGQRIGLTNALPAALMVVCIPKAGLLWLRALVNDSAREEQTARKTFRRLQERVGESLHETAEAVEQAAGVFPQHASSPHDPAHERESIIRAVLPVCAGCSSRGACWREREAAVMAVEEMLLPYAQGLRPRAGEPLKSDCAHTVAISAAAACARDSYRAQCAQQYYAGMQRAFAYRQL